MNNDIPNTEIIASDISTEDYNTICNNVLDYILSFNNEDKIIQKNFVLKREHTNRVIGYSEVLSRSLELEQDDVLTAQLIALLHDIGRFNQLAQYNTFNDSQSEDHAQMALDIIREKSWIVNLPDYIQEYINKAIYNHNKLFIPKNENKKTVLLSKIIRDADKIDILDIAIKEYQKKPANRNEKFTLDLEGKPQITKSIVKAVINGKLPDKKNLNTVNDFKLMQLAYVYDINFKKTFSIINQKQYLKQLFDTLPKNDDVFEAYRKTKIHVENQLI
ncbi:MAG: HD domain-containing protein [Prolixibacteraceae bacterium]|nr:HD domain-containing protein [Prolixibacteraceae bacterium]